MLIEKGVDVNNPPTVVHGVGCKDYMKTPFIIMCAINGQLDTLIKLIKYGAQINKIGPIQRFKE
jgi:hypothetical protein